MSEDGYRPHPANLDAVVKLKDSQPQTIGDVRKLLGVLGYYRHHIPNFARIAKPLFDQLKDLSFIRGGERAGAIPFSLVNFF